MTTFTKNGKLWKREELKCDRCGGRGIYAVGTHNGELVPAHPDAGVCYKCHGSGKVIKESRVLTEKEQAQRERAKARRQQRIQAQREARQQGIQEAQAEFARQEQERQARIKALKAVSQHQGEVGDKLELEVTLEATFSYDSYGPSNIHILKDAQGNKYKWFTKVHILKTGKPILLTGTVKGHDVYKGEKQTILTRCKILGEKN